MATTIGIRLEDDLVKALDAFVRELEKKNPGMRVTKSDAARMLLINGLEATKGKR